MVSIAAVATVVSTTFLAAVIGVMAYFAFSLGDAGRRADTSGASAAGDD